MASSNPSFKSFWVASLVVLIVGAFAFAILVYTIVHPPTRCSPVTRDYDRLSQVEFDLGATKVDRCVQSEPRSDDVYLMATGGRSFTSEVCAREVSQVPPDLYAAVPFGLVMKIEEPRFYVVPAYQSGCLAVKYSYAVEGKLSGQPITMIVRLSRYELTTELPIQQ